MPRFTQEVVKEEFKFRCLTPEVSLLTLQPSQMGGKEEEEGEEEDDHPRKQILFHEHTPLSVQSSGCYRFTLQIL